MYVDFSCFFQYMIDHGISFDPEYLFEDVQNTVYNVHRSGEIHRTIARDLGEFSTDNN